MTSHDADLRRRAPAVVIAGCAASLLLAVGCRIAELDLDGLPCPCASTAWQCDEATSTCVPAEPGPFSLTVTRPWSVLPQTRSGILTVELATETQQSITVQFRNLPAGLTAAPGRLTLSRGAPTADLTVTASTAAALGTVTLELEGTGPAGDRVIEQVRFEIGGHPGTLDPTFGDQGIREVAPGLANGLIFPRMALRPDDRIVIAALSGSDCIVTQYTADGQIDPGFAFTRTMTGSACGANGIALQPDGKIVVVGRWGNPHMPMVLRYLASGGADPSFGTAGVSLVQMQATLQSVAVRGDGRIVAVGRTQDGNGDGHIALFRFLADGTPDPGFGTGGVIVTTLSSESDGASAMQLLADDRLIVAGQRSTSPPRALLARFLADGSLDPSFGGTGLIIGEPRTELTTLLARSDGLLVVGGLYSDGMFIDAADGSFVAGYDSAGRLDPGFGEGGVTVFDSAQPPNAGVTGIVETPLSPLVVADSSLLMALDGTGRLDPEFGYVATPLSPISALAIQTSGKLVALTTTFASGRAYLMRLWP
jgi:uncharacterized delta-60 repeat protein